MNILITGASSGFGAMFVADLIKAGHRVAGSIRDPEGRNAAAAAKLKSLGAHVVEIDVTDEASVNAGVADAQAKLGSIDVLINNAGVGVLGLQENFSVDDFQRVFDINVFGVQRMMRAVLPEMRTRGSGLVVNISSILGRVTFPFNGPYNASKWALEALSENYRVELSGFGIEVAIVEPGGFRTNFFGNVLRPSSNDRDAGYGELAAAPESTVEEFDAYLKENPQQSPQLVSDAVVEVVGKAPGTRPFRTTVDKIGMGEPIIAYNDHLNEVTKGIYGAFGMDGMLSVNTAAGKPG